jgi:hypothetical protein
MKMWVSVTSSGEVSNIIKAEDLEIESYTERLVTMFNAIVSRDAQSPHGKFYFVAKRLQERFAQIKEGTSKTDQPDTDYDAGQTPSQGHKTSSRQSANQTPLHLLSEVAMGSSSSGTPQQQSQAQSRSQQQARAALQAHAQHTQQPMQQNWYSGMAAQPDMLGLQQQNFDLNFDFTQFDLGTGSDADLSALFIPDSMMWSYPPDQVMPQNYGGF